jgi:hypothetical protein
MPVTFIASLADGEAVLRFPFDEHLRQLLRAIPGRRWDPEERVWRVPLDPDRAEALTRFFAIVSYPVRVSDALDRALERRRAKRRPDQCVLDLARPDQSWWFSFATDHAEDLVATLLEHPGAYSLPAIGRALIPLDPVAARLVRAIVTQTPRLRLTDDAHHALVEIAERVTARPEETLDYDVELRRDRAGRTWILIAAAHAPLVRSLAPAHRSLWPLRSLTPCASPRSWPISTRPRWTRASRLGWNAPPPGTARSRSTGRRALRCSCSSATRGASLGRWARPDARGPRARSCR